MLFSSNTFVTLLFSFSSFFSPSLAQQYAGDKINNTLPAVAGAELAFFKIRDSKNQNATLLNYYSLASNGAQINPANIKRTVIVIHGLLRDPYLYINNVMQALGQVNDSSINKDNVAMIAPYFPNGDDKGVGYPWTTGLSAGKGSTSNALVWSGSQWASGADNQYPVYPTNITTISSYDVLDQLIQYFDNSALFPNMNQIVIAGHSLGGQTVQRYAAVGNLLKTRPFDHSTCATYDDWRFGFSNYNNRYGSALVAQGRAAALARINSRRVTYARGTLDFGDDSSNCAPNATGTNRGERFFNLIKQFPISCANPKVAGGACSTVDYVKLGHDAGGMMSSPAGVARLFKDNFNGDGSFAYNFGYPRLQAGDDQYPDPALAPTAKNWTTIVYPNSMTYQGCYTNPNQSTLSYTAFRGNASTTVGGCTSLCLGAGYSTAGLSWGYDCYCGNAVSPAAVQTADGACTNPCSGSTSDFCGGQNVLAIYNTTMITPTTSSAATSNLTCTNNASNGTTYQASNGGTYQVLCSLDSFGGDISGASSPNLSACMETCDKTSGCIDVSFTGGNCWLKSSIAGFYANTNVITGKKLSTSTTTTTTTTTTTSVASNTTTSAASNTSTSLSCTNNASNGTIYKATNGGSYTIRCQTDHYGGDIGSRTTTSLSDCVDACDTTTGCIDISFVSGSPNCWLKGSPLTAAYANANVVTAEKVVT
ncbi:hypothetical protein EG328_005625 [Venturia inaequalis]|uniref:WSC domain-containing protein n=1 Tax=Venturia inaequalis TaxID=5025 RepID=A0A8H3Z7G4_VENIN|nr:hypothetical protein EG328_005625 [Venturia inaequalis]